MWQDFPKLISDCISACDCTRRKSKLGKCERSSTQWEFSMSDANRDIFVSCMSWDVIHNLKPSFIVTKHHWRQISYVFMTPYPKWVRWLDLLMNMWFLSSRHIQNSGLSVSTVPYNFVWRRRHWKCFIVLRHHIPVLLSFIATSTLIMRQKYTPFLEMGLRPLRTYRCGGSSWKWKGSKSWHTCCSISTLTASITTEIPMALLTSTQDGNENAELRYLVGIALLNTKIRRPPLGFTGLEDEIIYMVYLVTVDQCTVDFLG